MDFLMYYKQYVKHFKKILINKLDNIVKVNNYNVKNVNFQENYIKFRLE